MSLRFFLSYPFLSYPTQSYSTLSYPNMDFVYVVHNIVFDTTFVGTIEQTYVNLDLGTISLGTIEAENGEIQRYECGAQINLST